MWAPVASLTEPGDMRDAPSLVHVQRDVLAMPGLRRSHRAEILNLHGQDDMAWRFALQGLLHKLHCRQAQSEALLARAGEARQGEREGL